MRDEILAGTLACFEPWHRHRKSGDRNSFDTFCRLLAKNVTGGTKSPNLHLMLRLDQIRSERVTRTTLELTKTFVPGHTRCRPLYLDSPLIVAVYEGRERLLDGNTRLNYWLSQGDNSPHPVHLHHIEGPGEFIELPPVA